MESEYIGVSDATKEVIWISSLFTHLLSLDAYPQEIFVHNQGAIQPAKNPKFQERTKHIGVQYQFVRDACERNAMRITYLPTSEMIADITMKSLPQETHWKHVNGMGMVRVRIRWHPEMRRHPDMTEFPSTGLGGSLPSFLLMALLYIVRSCARIIL